jgi:hypothetical protein
VSLFPDTLAASQQPEARPGLFPYTELPAGFPTAQIPADPCRSGSEGFKEGERTSLDDHLGLACRRIMNALGYTVKSV